MIQNQVSNLISSVNSFELTTLTLRFLASPPK